jgi:hypothetical protein
MCTNPRCNYGKVSVCQGEGLADCPTCRPEKKKLKILKSCGNCGRAVHEKRWVIDEGLGYKPVCFGCQV